MELQVVGCAYLVRLSLAPDVLGLIIAPVGRRLVILAVIGALVLVVHAHVK